MKTPDDKIFINNNQVMYLEFIRTRDQRKRIEERIDRMEKEIQELKTMVESLVNRSSGENK
jgi:hypothetical protein